MSGPKTVSYSMAWDAVRQSDRARERAVEREARRVSREAERRQRHAEQQRVLDLKEAAWQAANCHRQIKALAEEVRAWQERLPGQVGISVQVVAPPAGDDLTALTRYVADTGSLIRSTRSRLDDVRPALESKWAILTAARADGGHADEMPKSALDALHSVAPHNTTPATVARAHPDAVFEMREQALALVRQLVASEQSPIPDEIETKLGELVTVSDEREAAALTLEIRSMVERFRAMRTAEKAEAQRILASIPSEAHAALDDVRQRLRQTATGVERLTDAVRDAARTALAAYTEERRIMRESAAAIIRTSLENLGYVVEPVEHTLFVRGGTVHFRKAGWGDGYYMRLRVDEQHMNFNMVRVDDEAVAVSDTTDVVMENAWCDGFSRVQDAFADAGLRTSVTRHLAAGDKPVQRVTADSLNATFWVEQRAAQQHTPAQSVAGRHMEKDS